jgi:hypothetical protein
MWKDVRWLCVLERGKEVDEWKKVGRQRMPCFYRFREDKLRVEEQGIWLAAIKRN